MFTSDKTFVVFLFPTKSVSIDFTTSVYKLFDNPSYNNYMAIIFVPGKFIIT